MHPHEIEHAINAAECVAHPTSPDSTPVTVTNKTLLTLIAAARTAADIASRLQDEEPGVRRRVLLGK